MKTAALVVLTVISCSQQAFSQSTAAELKKVKDHPMQYYISLPAGWSAKKQWPVVLVLEAAEKEFEENANRFVTARSKMPFIIVAPIHTDNGNQARRDPKIFPYSTETWDYIDKVGDCAFNDEGIAKVLKEVADVYHGESKVFVTGFEAGAHRLWSIVFNHPEYLKAAAPVAGNFRNRCVEETALVKSNVASSIPIHSFVGEADPYFGPKSQNHTQWTNAKDMAVKKGYLNITETVISGKDHVPMPREVMDYFYSLLKK